MGVTCQGCGSEELKHIDSNETHKAPESARRNYEEFYS